MILGKSQYYLLTQLASLLSTERLLKLMQLIYTSTGHKNWDINKIKQEGKNRSSYKLITEKKGKSNDNDTSRSEVINPNKFASTLPEGL